MNINLLLLICVAIVFLINISFWFSDDAKGGTGWAVLWCLLTVFSMFYAPENGDVLFSKEDFNYFYMTGNQYHYEPFYFWIANILPHNYLIWRFAVWGLASFLLIQTFKLIDCSPQFATMIFIVITLIPCFYYLRNSLSFAALYLAATLLFTLRDLERIPRAKRAILIIGLIVFAFFTHNSFPLYFVICILALSLPANKYVIIVSLICFPVIRHFVESISQLFLGLDIISTETRELGEFYLDETNDLSSNINGYISMVLAMSPFLVAFYHFIFNVKKEDMKNYAVCKFFILTTYFIFYISFAFLGIASHNMFMRFFNSAFFPMAIAFLCLYKEREKSKAFDVFTIAFAINMAVQIYTLIAK